MRTAPRTKAAQPGFWSLTALLACTLLNSGPLEQQAKYPDLTHRLPQLLRLLPADTQALIGLPAAQGSSQGLAGRIRSEILFAAGIDLSGIQPLLDALLADRQILLAAMAGAEGQSGWVALIPDPPPERTLQAARQAGFSQTSEQDGAVRMSLPAAAGGGDSPLVLAGGGGGGGDSPLILAVRQPHLMLLGAEFAVRHCLEQQRSQGEGLAAVPGFLQRVRKAHSGAQIWGVARKQWLGRESDGQLAAGLPDGFLLKSLQGVEAVQFTVRVGSQAEFRMSTEAALESHARVLADELAEFISRAAPSGAPQEVRQVMQSAQVERRGRKVELQMSIPPEAMARIRGNSASPAILRWRLPAVERERSRRIGDLMEWVKAQAGSRVADIGAGNGFMTFRLARLAGPQGKVYAVEIRPELVEQLQERARRNGMTQVEAVLGAEDDPRLPPGELDAVLIVNAYHEMPHYREMLRHILLALRPGGRLVLNEPYSLAGSSKSRAEQAEDHQIAPDLAQQDLLEAGFEILHRQDDFIASKHEGHEHRDWLIVAVRSPEQAH